MLAYIERPDSDVVFRASLVHLLATCPDARKLPVLQRCLKDSSPLVRAAAASALGNSITPDSVSELAAATGDEYRLVRIRAAAALARVPAGALPANKGDSVRKASVELKEALMARPDDFANQTNLGNYYLERGELEPAVKSFETAIRLRPDSVGTLVNASIAYSRAGRAADSERVLRQAIQHAPDNAAANMNLGLLLAEAGRKQEAEAALRKALVADGTLAQAAFNLCVLLAPDQPEQSLSYCRQAAQTDSQNDKYIFTYAYYLVKSGNPPAAAQLLEAHVKRGSAGLDSLMLLADLELKSGKLDRAAAVYRSALNAPDLPAEQRRFIEGRLTRLDFAAEVGRRR